MAEETPNTTNSANDNKLMKVLCYFGILWLIPYLAVKGEERDSSMILHLRQGFGCMLIGILYYCFKFVAFAGIILSLLWGILSLIGIIYVVTGKNQKLPIVGDMFDSAFSFIK